jgi:hypothetical protein
VIDYIQFSQSPDETVSKEVLEDDIYLPVIPPQLNQTASDAQKTQKDDNNQLPTPGSSYRGITASPEPLIVEFESGSTPEPISVHRSRDPSPPNKGQDEDPLSSATP